MIVQELANKLIYLTNKQTAIIESGHPLVGSDSRTDRRIAFIVICRLDQ